MFNIGTLATMTHEKFLITNIPLRAFSRNWGLTTDLYVRSEYKTDAKSGGSYLLS